MKRYCLFFSFVSCLILFVPISTQAAVVGIGGTDWLSRPLSGSYDFVQQVLTLNLNNILIISNLDEVYGYSEYVGGTVFNESTFTVVKNLTNNSDIPWTSMNHHFYNEPVRSWIIEDTFTSSRPAVIQFTSGPFHIWSSVDIIWDKPIMPGETVTIQFDVFCNGKETGYFSFMMGQAAVPEPATISLLASGGLFLRARYRRRLLDSWRGQTSHLHSKE